MMLQKRKQMEEKKEKNKECLIIACHMPHVVRHLINEYEYEVDLAQNFQSG